MLKIRSAHTRRRRALHELYSLALSIMIVTTACAQQPQSFGAEYVPFPDGARWIYRMVRTNIDGRKISIRATVTIDGKTLIQGKEYVRQVTTYEVPGVRSKHPARPIIAYFRVGTDGIYKIDGKNMDAPEVFDTPLPITAGTRWGRDTMESRAEYVGDVIVSGRTYRDCLRVTSVAPNFRNVMYLAPHTGVVKADTTGAGDFDLIMELESYVH